MNWSRSHLRISACENAILPSMNGQGHVRIYRSMPRFLFSLASENKNLGILLTALALPNGKVAQTSQTLHDRRCKFRGVLPYQRARQWASKPMDDRDGWPRSRWGSENGRIRNCLNQ